MFREFIASDEMTALAADVVGPDVKFHHAKLNFKSGRGSRGFKWHQQGEIAKNLLTSTSSVI